MEDKHMIHRLRSYRNGIHGGFFLEVAERLALLPQWIPVSERLPEEEGYVMCSRGKGCLPYFVQYAQGVFWDNLLSERRDYPNFWQPLPQPPEEG